MWKLFFCFLIKQLVFPRMRLTICPFKRWLLHMVWSLFVAIASIITQFEEVHDWHRMVVFGICHRYTVLWIGSLFMCVCGDGGGLSIYSLSYIFLIIVLILELLLKTSDTRCFNWQISSQQFLVSLNPANLFPYKLSTCQGKFFSLCDNFVDSMFTMFTMFRLSHLFFAPLTIQIIFLALHPHMFCHLTHL